MSINATVIIRGSMPEVTIDAVPEPHITVTAPSQPEIVLRDGGLRGPKGADSAGAVDPGELNLYFDMALI